MPRDHQNKGPHELEDAIARIVACQLGRFLVDERHVPRSGQGMGQVDVIEHLDYPDAALVRLGR